MSDNRRLMGARVAEIRRDANNGAQSWHYRVPSADVVKLADEVLVLRKLIVRWLASGNDLGALATEHPTLKALMSESLIELGDRVE